jgi:hypothetical protein
MLTILQKADNKLSSLTTTNTKAKRRKKKEWRRKSEEEQYMYKKLYYIDSFPTIFSASSLKMLQERVILRKLPLPSVSNKNDIIVSYH